jgi:hypothetical protein
VAGVEERDLRFTAGLLNQSDAARYLGIPAATFNRWGVGYDRGGPLVHLLPEKGAQRQGDLYRARRGVCVAGASARQG